MKTLAVNDETWDKIFEGIKVEFMADPNFHADCKFWDVASVYEMWFGRRGINLIRKYSRRTHDWDQIWGVVEIPDDDLYTELVLRYC